MCICVYVYVYVYMCICICTRVDLCIPCTERNRLPHLPARFPEPLSAGNLAGRWGTEPLRSSVRAVVLKPGVLSPGWGWLFECSSRAPVSEGGGAERLPSCPKSSRVAPKAPRAPKARLGSCANIWVDMYTHVSLPCVIRTPSLLGNVSPCARARNDVVSCTNHQSLRFCTSPSSLLLAHLSSSFGISAGQLQLWAHFLCRLGSRLRHV